MKHIYLLPDNNVVVLNGTESQIAPFLKEWTRRSVAYKEHGENGKIWKNPDGHCLFQKEKPEGYFDVGEFDDPVNDIPDGEGKVIREEVATIVYPVFRKDDGATVEYLTTQEDLNYVNNALLGFELGRQAGRPVKSIKVTFSNGSDSAFTETELKRLRLEGLAAMTDRVEFA